MRAQCREFTAADAACGTFLPLEACPFLPVRNGFDAIETRVMPLVDGLFVVEAALDICQSSICRLRHHCCVAIVFITLS
jgi:hypothetical protein